MACMFANSYTCIPAAQPAGTTITGLLWFNKADLANVLADSYQLAHQTDMDENSRQRIVTESRAEEASLKMKMGTRF